jgi:hypothetical protein
MDMLSNIPTTDELPAPDEEHVVKKYFNEQQTTPSSEIRYKLILYTTLLFVLMSLPIVDCVIAKLPYLDNVVVRTAAKAVIFAFVFFATSYILTSS